MTVFNNKNGSCELVNFYVIKTIYQLRSERQKNDWAPLMYKMALGQDFLQVTLFPLTILFHKSSIHIHLSITDNIQFFILTVYLNNEITKWLGTKMICELRVVKERE